MNGKGRGRKPPPFFCATNCKVRGFVRARTGKFVQLDSPGTTNGTSAARIGPNGKIVGTIGLHGFRLNLRGWAN